MDSRTGKLNPLLRLAAISGVEAAVRLHIRRGDDIDARDGGGSTPLILAAMKGRAGVVQLLLDAGANPTLVDCNGRDAFAHSLAAGCQETVALLTEALASFSPTNDGGDRLPVQEADTPAVESVSGSVTGLPVILADELGLGGAVVGGEASNSSHVSFVGPLMVQDIEVARGGDSGAFILDSDPLDRILQDGWEIEEEPIAPQSNEFVAEAARQVHTPIGRYKAVDCDPDWSDVDLHLPERAAPLEREAGDGAIQALLLAALREGMVSEDELIGACSNADGTRNEGAERLLAVVVGELGATVAEWAWMEEPFRAEPSVEEERLLMEATEFAEDLASCRNDPFRFYSRDLRGDLLGAEEEISLGREMEKAGRAALSALALWPAGLSVLFDVADRVARGKAEAESFCAGQEPCSDEESLSWAGSARDSSDESDEPELNEDASFFVSAIAAVKVARGDPQRVTKALEEARLTRGFLLELAGKAEEKEAGRDFVEALERQAAARDRMILSNLRLALSIAKKHLWSEIPLDDLVQEANIGLMKAVERFDWRRGFRFSTYATWWIRQQVSRSIADTGRVVRVPVHIQETARTVLRERDEAEVRLGCPEHEAETARRAGMSPAKTRMLLAIFDETVALDEIDPDTGLPRADDLPDTSALNPEDVVEHASLRLILLGMLDELDERSREVILLRFGFAGGDTLTLEEVGQRFGVTRERIRQIESKTMRRLSRRNNREVLWPFMGDGYASSRLSLSEAAEKPVEASARMAKEKEQASPVSPIERAASVFPLS